MISIAYNEDCFEGLKRFPGKYFDLAVIDPPYGINASKGTWGSTNKGKVTNYGKKDWDKEPPTQEFFDELFRVSKNQIIFGANHFIERINKNSSCWLVWDKDNSCDFADCELAWTSFNTAVRKFKYRWNGMLQENMKDKEIRIHPTHKPIKLYAWIYNKFLPNGGKVIDTHLGSGSNRIAADMAGNIDFIGFEIDETYFRDQEKRYMDYKSQLKLNFDPHTNC